MTELTLSQRTQQLPRQNPRDFLFLAALIWLALYLSLIPVSEAIVAALPVDRDSHWGGALQFFFYDTPTVLLLLVAMGMLAWEAIHRLGSPQPIAGVTIMVVAGIGIAVNTATALLFMRGREHDLNIRGAFLHMAADALVSAGVVVAGGLALWFGWDWLDPVVGLVIAAVIVVGTWNLFKQTLHLMFDGVPEGVDLLEVRDLLEALPGVARVEDLHIWAMGTSENALTARLVMPAGGAHDAFLQDVTQQLHDRFGIEHVTLQPVRVPFARPCASPGA